eukprot:3562823-Prymnesium_polylepis.1
MPLSDFAVFGEAVNAYMHFVYRLMCLFLLLFLLSLTNVFTNVEGTDMGDALNLFNQLSLGNVDVLKVGTAPPPGFSPFTLRPPPLVPHPGAQGVQQVSNAIMEFVISGVLVRFLFWARQQQLNETSAARASEVRAPHHATTARRRA